MRSALRTRAVVGLVLLGAWGSVALSQDKSIASGSPTPGKCAPLRTILADGRIMVRRADCTTSTTAKPEAGRVSPDSLEPLMPVAPEPEQVDPAIQQKYLEALRGYYQYRIDGYEHRRQVFAWQLFSSKVIFAVVLLLVCSGIYFAALQFHAGMKRQSAGHAGKKASGAAAGAGFTDSSESAADVAVTTFSAGTEGIKVSSPVLGVVILTISLAFFYLYLVYVYPISDVF